MMSKTIKISGSKSVFKFLTKARNILLGAAFLYPALVANAQNKPQYKVITIVESIVPTGIGRSRIVENQSELSVDDFTTTRTNGKKSDQGEIKRKDARVNEFAETKLLNFYSVTEINFQNIASNDALISSKLNELTEEGWELMFMASGVESNAGATDDHGIYITRFVFKK